MDGNIATPAIVLTWMMIPLRLLKFRKLRSSNPWDLLAHLYERWVNKANITIWVLCLMHLYCLEYGMPSPHGVVFSQLNWRVKSTPFLNAHLSTVFAVYYIRSRQLQKMPT